MRLVQVAEHVPDVTAAQHLHRWPEIRESIYLAQQDDRIRIQTALAAYLRNSFLPETSVNPHAGQHAEQPIIGFDEVRNFHVTRKLVHIKTNLRKIFAIFRNIPNFAVPK